MSAPDYNTFRTGLTFQDVRKQLQLEARKKYLQGVYMFITRATVLGRWHEIKKNMFQQEVKMFEMFARGEL